MNVLVVLPYYARWHYSRGLKDFLHNWKNLLGFLVDFFSLEILFKTLFSPWERMSEGYGSGFKPGQFLETLIVNVLMRVFGFVARSIVLVLGFISIGITMVLGVCMMICWIVLPALILFLIALSIHNFLS